MPSLLLKRLASVLLVASRSYDSRSTYAMPGAYKVAYIFPSYEGYAAYIYQGQRDDHQGQYEQRVYRNATRMDHVFSANYEIGYPYTLNEEGFFPTAHGHGFIPNAQAPTWWRVFKSWLVGVPVPVARAIIAIALAYFFKKALKRRAVGGR